MASEFETPFLFALTNPGNEDLLKESVKVSGQKLVPSFSRSGFVSFKKASGNITVKDLLEFPLSFARLVGADAKALAKDSAPPESFFDCEEQVIVGDGPLSRPDENLHFKLKGDSYWSCPQSKVHSLFSSPYGTPALERPEDSPSRAYLKIAESLELAPLERVVPNIRRVIELGCAPGGASTFLLSKNFEVYGIDPAIVDERVVSNPSFHYLKKPTQDVTRADLPGRFELMASDMNLNPSQTVAFSLKLLEQLESFPTALLITLKTPDIKWVSQLKSLAEKFRQIGYNQISFAQLPTHRRETLLYCLRGRK